MSLLFIYLTVFFLTAFNLFAQTPDTSTAALQAVGQDTLISWQLTSDNIVNVVSPIRIRELQDENMVESIGRLPGVSLLRTGGQARQLVIRGMNPEHNRITIAGVPIPANESYRPSLEGGEEFGGGRGVDMRIIPSGSVDNITVYKTYTPDMDAAFLGGTVDLGIRKARKSLPAQPFGLSYLPSISLQAQGGYTGITSEYDNYKFDLSLEKRFLDERLGISVQGSIQQQNLTWDRLNADYIQTDQANSPDQLALTNLDLYFYPRKEKNYNGTITLDYEIPNGNLSLSNIFSQCKSNNNNYEQNYNLQRGGNSISYYGGQSSNELNLISNIFNYKQKTSIVNIDATLSHSYTENISPDTWTLGFDQISAGTDQINVQLPPVKIAELAHQKVNIDEMNLRRIITNDSFTRQRELRGSINLSRDFKLTDFLSLELKAGGMYSYTNCSYDYNTGTGVIFFGGIGERIVETYPWLTTDYGIGSNVTPRLFLTPFLDYNINMGKFLDGNYGFNNQLNLNYLNTIKEIIVDYGLNVNALPAGGALPWLPSVFGSQASDYSGDEKRSAGYLMGTFNLGESVSIMTGVRYQNLATSYSAYRFYNASGSNTYPLDKPHIVTKTSRSYGYWLPAVHLKLAPVPWLSLRASYTHTLAYPNYPAIIPIIDVYTAVSSVVWNNVDLKPAQSKNFDLQLSVNNNELGLFTFGGFLKRIDDYVFRQESFIENPSVYGGLHDVPLYLLLGNLPLNVTGYALRKYYNSPHRVDVRGIECNWQTHFWYLPDPLNGLILNVNYTHIFSGAEYAYTIVANSGPPDFQLTHKDTTYVDRLINQPDDIINISLGYDYKGFSILLSMVYQSGIFNNTNYYNALRSDKAEYVRWDLAAKQKLPWYNIEMFMNLNNLTGENDTYIMRGNGYPVSETAYGLSAEAGFRVNIH